MQVATCLRTIASRLGLEFGFFFLRGFDLFERLQFSLAFITFS